MRIILTGGFLGMIAVVGCVAGGDTQFHNTSGGGNGASMSTGSGTGAEGGSINLIDGGTGAGGANGADTVVTPGCTANCMDFPATPILDGNVPSNPGTLFGSPSSFTP